MKAPARALAVLVVVAALAGAGALLCAWAEPGCTDYDVVYDGYGEVACSRGEVTLHPAAASAAGETHAALVVTPYGTTAQADPQVLTATTSTAQQLRQGEPNPWEVGWLLWNYKDPARFYALVLKPNGWEVSKQDAAYPGSQRFLASGSDRVFEVGTSHEIEVTLTSSGSALRMEIVVDGEHLATVTDSESPYTSGSLALYCEDAVVTFSEMSVSTSRP